MTYKTKIQRIKLFIKISIVVIVICIFIVLGFFVKPTPSFENSNMKKWPLLSDNQKTDVLKNILKNDFDQDLLIKCVDKIAELPDSSEMQIRDAVSLCYNGIILNSETDDQK